jgi:hypothetical protein
MPTPVKIYHMMYAKEIEHAMSVGARETVALLLR